LEQRYVLFKGEIFYYFARGRFFAFLTSHLFIFGIYHFGFSFYDEGNKQLS